MEIKFFKKSLSIIIIMTIIIASMMISKSEAVETLESGKTLLDYVDVNVVPEKGKELKIMLPNYAKTVIAKVKVLPTGKELKIMQDKTSQKYYVTYTGEAGKITLEFYKKAAKSPYMSKQMEVQKGEDGTYSAIVAPRITYGKETDNDKIFNVTDAKGISEIVICKRNAKGVYDYKEENIIYRLKATASSEDTQAKCTKKYIEKATLTKQGNNADIKIKRFASYGYYEIKVTGISGLMHTREVKVRGKMKTAKPIAKTENGFAPSIKVDKSNKNKVTFKIDKANKVTSAKMYQVIDGKVNSKEVKLNDIKKTGDYITSFTFAKEGMYRLKLLNKSGESAASITDFIINRKDNTETWRVNESPRVVKSTVSKDIQKIKISDGAIKSIKIFVKGSKGYDLTKPIYKYENGQVKNTTAKYIDENKSSDKDKNKNNIYIALKRSTSATTKYLIQVTDHGGNDPELIKNRMIHVDKAVTEVEKKDTSKSSEKTVKKDTSKKNTNSSSNTQKKTVKKNSKPTISWDSDKLELSVTDPDGIASVIRFGDGASGKFKRVRTSNKVRVYKLKDDTSIRATFKAKVKDKTGKTEWTDNSVTLELSNKKAPINNNKKSTNKNKKKNTIKMKLKSYITMMGHIYCTSDYEITSITRTNMFGKREKCNIKKEKRKKYLTIFLSNYKFNDTITIEDSGGGKLTKSYKRAWPTWMWKEIK